MGLVVWDLTHISLVSFYMTLAISAEPDQTPQNAATDQVPHYLLIECTFIQGSHRNSKTKFHDFSMINNIISMII